MTWLWITAASVAVGALIGGVTNTLAIKMLFRPYRPWKVGPWTVPFTPGLIPKRRAEIAQQMGKMVEHYLLTPEGIRRVLRDGTLQNELKRFLIRKAEEAARSRKTLSQHWENQFGRPLEEDVFGEDVRSAVAVWVRRWLEAHRDTSLAEWLPPSWSAWGEAGVEKGVDACLDRLRDYFQSEEGRQAAANWVRGAFENHPVFRSVAGLLLREPHLASKVGESISTVLDRPDFRHSMKQMLLREWDQWLEQPLATWLKEEDMPRVEETIRMLCTMIGENVFNRPMAQWMRPLLPYLKDSVIPEGVSFGFSRIEKRVEHLLKKVQLTKIVSREVTAFPLRRLETMILHISGRELKMIQFLGAVLGGFIGMVQAVTVLLWV